MEQCTVGDRWSAQDKSKLFLEIGSEGLDPTSAKDSALETALYWLSIIQLAAPAMRLSVDRDCRAISATDTKNYTVETTSIEILGPISSQADSTALHRQNSLLSNSSVCTHSRERILSALRSYRAAMSCRTQNECLLHLWVALETLVVGGGADKIYKLIDVVAAVNSLFYPYRSLSDLVSNLERFDLIDAVPRDFASRHVFLLNFFDTLLTRDKFQDLMISTGQVSLALAERLNWVGTSLQTQEAIRRAVNRNSENVRRHLWRIYRARNALVHGGKSVGNLGSLSSHLFAYFYRTQNRIRTDLESFNSITDINDSCQKILGTEKQFLARMKSKDPLTSSSYGVVFRPFDTLWPQNTQ